VLLLLVLVGLGGGLALTALSGARRTDTAMPRFVAYSHPGTGSVFFGENFSSPPAVSGAAAFSPAPPPYARAVLSLPQVENYNRALYLFTSTNGRAPGVVNTFGLLDATALRAAERPFVVAGHLPDPSSPFDVVIDELAASKLHARVGSSLHLRSVSAAQLALSAQPSSAGPGPAAVAGPFYTLRVAAVVRFVPDVNAIVPYAAKQDVEYEGQQNAFLTPAFATHLAHDLGIPVQQLSGMNVFSLRLRHGNADWKPFVAAAKKQAALERVPVSFQAGDPLNIIGSARSAERGIRVEALALAVFGGVAALVTLLLVGQAVARQLSEQSAERDALRSLGATRLQLAAGSMLRPAVVAVGGSLFAFTVAVLASPLMPIGLAHKAEIHPGFEINWSILPAATAGLALIVLARSAIPAWRLSRFRPDADRVPAAGTDRLARVLSTGSGPLPAIIGVRFSFGSASARQAATGATALVGAIVAVAALAASMTFGGSLAHLIHTPRQQGWSWDLLVGNPNDTTDAVAAGGPSLSTNRYVASYSALGLLGQTDIDGRPVPQVLAIDRLKGSVYPPLLSGRAPAAPDEIVLAPLTMSLLHKHLGQVVQLNDPDGKQYRMRIVGQMLAPSVGDLLTNGLGEGAWIDASFVHQQWRSATDPSGTPPEGTDVLNLFMVRLWPGTPTTTAVTSLRADFGPRVLQHLPAEDAINLQSVSGLPFALSALIALLGAATIGHALVSSVRRRRRDLAVLKTLGFVKAQVAATVAWQATSFALVALVVGIPLGVASGRWAWTAVASSIYSVSPPLIPVLAVALIFPAALVVCNLIAAGPARTAGRLSPALAMRSE
jgi:hypothetical protein